MRTLVAAILAVPVIAATYVPRSLRTSRGFRALLLAAASVATVVVLGPGILALALPSPSTAAGSSLASAAEVAPSSTATVARDPLAALGSVEGIAVAAPAPRVAQAALRAEAAFVDEGPTAGAPAALVATAVPVAALPVAGSAAVAPAVVRFRPRPGTTGVVPAAPVSVRFTQPMTHGATQKAFTVRIGAKAVTGTYAWFERSTVLVLTPATRFPAGATVTLSVSRGARSAAGVALRAASSATFRVEPAAMPAVRAVTTKTSAPTRTSSVTPSGSGLHAVELYYLSLMNCTRMGGWVSSAGTCTGAGTRSVSPLVLDAGISDRVSRPYALFLASRNICSHFADGNPGDRLSRAGYRNWDWAENIGCLSVDPYRSMLLTHLFYQSEKPYGGGHYRNLMNPLYDRVGIGVEVVHGILRLVIDFYRP